MASAEDWAEAPDLERWLALWESADSQPPSCLGHWRAVRRLQRPEITALCSAGPSGSYLVSAAADGSLAVTDATTWQRLMDLREPGDEDAVTSLLSLARGEAVLAGTSSGSLLLWRTGDWQVACAARQAHADAVACLCLLAEDALLTAGCDSTLCVWQISSAFGPLQLRSTFRSISPVTAICALPAAGGLGAFIAGAENGNVSSWGVCNGVWRSDPLPSCHNDAVESVQRYNANTVFTLDNTLLLGWFESASSNSWKLHRTVKPWYGPSWALSAAGGKLLVAGNSCGQLQVWSCGDHAKIDDAGENVEDFLDAESLSSFSECSDGDSAESSTGSGQDDSEAAGDGDESMDWREDSPLYRKLPGSGERVLVDQSMSEAS